MAQLVIGTVKWFSPTRGYGFVHSPLISELIYLHVSQLIKWNEYAYSSFVSGERVVFYLLYTPRGPVATHVTKHGLDFDEFVRQDMYGRYM